MLAFMKELLDAFLDWVYGLMPTSPFTPYIEELGELPYLSYLNWFVPVKSFIIIGNAWLAAIFLWYFYNIILRWLKAIE